MVWIPMWDNVALHMNSDDWWDALPKTLRVVALSEKVAQKAQKAGLPTLNLQYHKDPSRFNEVNWQNGRILFYWNRTGLFGPKFIKKLCTVLDIHELYFRGATDPEVAGGIAYALPSKLGRTIVHNVSRFDSQQTYFEILRKCNIYLAPRALEGVGLTFLEAMAGGCAVLGYDAPTMNEYICHGEDGLLFTNKTMEKEDLSMVQKAWDVLPSWLWQGYPNRVSLSQDWDQIKNMDLELLGRTARVRQEIGFSTWEKRIPEYADFVLNW